MAKDTQNPQSLELARHLASYLPVTFVRQILDEGNLPSAGVPQGVDAATLFADVSGFTAMSEELATDGPRGAEELTRVLEVTFTAMVDVIHDLGGSISHYYGDAMSVYFPDDDGVAAQRALACAQEIQQLMSASLGRAVTNRPANKNPIFELTVKLGLGYGRCQSLIVGDPYDSMEFVLTGAGVDDATNAEKEAISGQIIASRTILEKAGLSANADFVLFDQAIERPPTKPLLNWDDYTDTAVIALIPLIQPFIHDALIHRFTSAGVAGLAEHRPATSIFLQVDFAGDDDDTSAIETLHMGQQLQDYYTWVVSVINRFSNDNARLNRVLTGDKGNQLHIIFGAPVAPDAPEQAARCALALIAEQPDFVASQRLGLTVGKVFAGLVGCAQRQEYTLQGAIVNLAARLMQHSETGMLLMDPATVARVGSKFETIPLPPRKLKGFQEPVILHQVVSEVESTQIETYLTNWVDTIVNREDEQQLLLSIFAKAQNGRGGVAALSGPTGVGKSHLLAIGVRSWLEQGGVGWMGVCYQHLSETPYAPWRDVWHEMFGLTPSMDVAEQVTAVLEKTKQLAPTYTDDAGLWREALGLPIPQTDLIAEMAPEARQARLFALVRACLRAVAQKRPLLIVFEDLQWADQATLSLLDDLASFIEEEPICIVMTHHPVENFKLEMFDNPAFSSIQLGDLTSNYARELLTQLVGTAELPLAVEQHLGMRGRDGSDSPVNPLFLGEAVNVMVESGVLTVDEQVKVDEILLSQLQVPDTIHGLLLERLDRLSPSGRDLLQVASVIGRQFELEPLRAISNKTAEPLVHDLLSELSSAEMTRLVTADPDWIYLFRHAMTHEVAYESMPYIRRQNLHALVANWLVDYYKANLKPYYALIAYHYGRAADHENGLKYALLAADEAKAVFANQEAVELYTLAEGHLSHFNLDDHWETAVHLYLSRAESLRFLGDFSTAITDSEQAVQLAEDNQNLEKMAQSINLLAELKCRQADFDETIQLTSKLITSNKTDISQTELARAYQWSGMAYASKGEYENALEYLFNAEELCLDGQNNERLARILETIAFVYFSQKHLDRALEAMERSIALSRNVSIPANVASALSNVSLIQVQLGKPKDALASIEDAINIIQDRSKNFLARLIGNRAEILAYLGNYELADSSYDEAIKLLLKMDDHLALIEVYISKAFDYHLPLLENELASYWLDKAKSLIELRPDAYLEKQVRLQLSYAKVALNRGDYRYALSLLEQAQSQIEERGFAWWYPVVCYFQGIALCHNDEVEKGLEQFNLGLEMVTREGNPDYLPLLLLELARNETENIEHRKKLLVDCAEAAIYRARQIDKKICLEFVLTELAKISDSDDLNFVKKLEAEMIVINNALNYD